ncbi:MAG: diguanylate cyclase [Treponema sp.]|nr:diguanylate cyclase [Treponema sp.]
MGKPKAADILNIAIVLLLLTVCTVCAYVLTYSKKAPHVKLFQRPAQNYNTGWYYIDGDGQKVYVPTLPVKIPCDPDGKSRLYHNYVSYEKKTICFFTHHQNARLLINGLDLYSYRIQGNPPWLKSFRSIYHVVNLPDTAKSTLCLEMEALIKGREGEYNEVYFGDRAAILYRLLRNRLDKLHLGIILAIFGIIVLLLGLSTLTRVGNEKLDFTLIFLGLSGVSLGVWQLEESRILQFFIGNQALHWCLEYMLQFCIIYFALLFIRSMTPPHFTGATNIFTGVILYFSSMLLVLQLLGITQITSSATILYILFMAICVYLVILIIFTMKFSNRLLKPIFCISMGISLLIFATITIMGNFRSKSLMDMWLTIGLLFMFFSLTVVVYQKTVEKFEKVKEAKLYEKLALVDFNTGVSSKTAWFYLIDKFDYSEHAGKIYCLILFDMNNLKKLNDTLGHLVGDKVINAFCDCMRDTFEDKGNIYRIGGDEFICLLEEVDEDEVEKLLKEFDRHVANQKETDHKFTVAYGWAMFKPHTKEDFITAQQRADSLMYDMKKRMKSQAALAETATGGRI